MDASSNSEISGVDKSAVNYANALWLRTTIVGAAGIVGLVAPVVPALVGAVDVALTTKAQKIAERRLNVLCQAWEQEMQTIPEESVDKEYIESEEFFDLVFNAWESTKRTRHDEKIYLYARLLTKAVPFQNRQENSPEDYLSVLSELTPKELQVAQALFMMQKEGPMPDENDLQWLGRINSTDPFQEKEKGRGHGQWKRLLLACPAISYEELEFILLRLQRSGLISELGGTYFDYLGGVYKIGSVFRKLMRYLNDTTK